MGENPEKPTKRGPGRPPKNIKYIPLPSTSTMQESIELTNRFEGLPEMDISDTETVSSGSTVRYKRRRVTENNPAQMTPKKPPPINIVGSDYKKIQQFIINLGIGNESFQTKLTKEGIRIFPATNDIHKQIHEALKDANTQFFTHQRREEQTTKIVLHGLFKMSNEEILESLAEFNVKPSKVVNLSIRQQKFSDHAVYLLHFPKSQNMKISALRENVKAIQQVRVRWEYYKNRRQGPIQCSNCMQYGHGKSLCFLNPICVSCGGDHASNACTQRTKVITDEATKTTRKVVPDELVKCGLCGQNHTANFRNCSKRQEFITRQNVFRQRTQRRHAPFQQQNHGFTTAPELNNFPALKSTRLQNFEYVHNQTTPLRYEFSQNQPSTSQIASEDLFSATELMEIFLELSAVAQRATSKQQQLIEISKIVTKYCNGR